MFRNYVKIALRNLRKRKVFTTINIVGLALGFGSSILIYLFLSHHLSFDNFHANEERIYRINTEQHREDIEFDASVPPGFAKVFREEYGYAEKVARIVRQEDMLIDFEAKGDRNKLKLEIGFIEEDFFDIFSFESSTGNSASLAAPNTAILTESLALTMFGKTDVIGATFVLENDKTIEIVGVLKDLPKASFLDIELFVSYPNLMDFFNFAAGESWSGISTNLQCFTLLRPNQDIAGIEANLSGLSEKYRPPNTSKHVYRLQPLSDVHLNSTYGGIDPTLLWVFGIIGLFLITIACINFINISTAQAFSRSKEIGVRKVLGGFKKHLFWQFMSETFVISLFALILGIVLAILFLPAFNNLFGLELSASKLLNVRFISLMLVALAVVSLLSGSYPGILLSRILPVLALKGKLKQNDTGGSKTRRVLVVAQFVISIILIASSSIIAKQIDFAINADLGFDKESIVMLSIPAEIESVGLNSLTDRLKQIPNVISTSACLSSPGAAENNWGTGVRYHNRPEKEEYNIAAKIGDESYLETFGVKLIAGRNFFAGDSITEVLVNEKFTKKLGLGTYEEIIGKRVEVNGADFTATVVGVVGDFHDQDFTQDISPAFIAANPNWYGEIGVKISGANTRTTLDQIEKEWSSTFSNYIFDYRFLDERVAEAYETEQQYLSLSKVFSGLAIFIGCLGLYGLVLFFVGQRTKEIGIRKVLGSTVGDILVLFSTDFVKLILISGVIATPLAWYFMNNWLQGYTYRTEIHWWHFALAIVMILGVTLLTIGYQTLKAAMVNPVKSLRSE